ncbi:MAG: ferrous iron transport protein B, partial [Arcanobacterium sp.]|nr:ferrous iron transport protein B [Arcanobacterium sp.]
MSDNKFVAGAPVSTLDLGIPTTLENAKARQRTVLLVGNTNVGKSTLFNGVTGMHQAMINAPGTTVEVMEGKWRTLNLRVIDLPGTYSLIPTSPDEAVVSQTIAGAPGTLTDITRGNRIDLVLAMLDGTSLTRSLYLLAQLAQTGHPVAAVVSLADVAARNGIEIDPSAISRALGIPVMTFDPRQHKGYAELDKFVVGALEAKARVKGLVPDPTAPGYSRQAANEILTVGCCGSSAQNKTGDCCGTEPDSHDLLGQTLCGCGKDLAPGEDCAREESNTPLSCGCGHESASSLELDSTYELRADDEAEAQLQRAKTLFSWVERVESQIEQHQQAPDKLSRSDIADRILLNPLSGPIIFFGLMWILFKLAGEWVGPLQDLFDGWFTNEDPGAISLANGFNWVLGLVGLETHWIQSFLVGGIATGLGVVASFVPLMFAIFVSISILEDSGYMARAAFLADRLMRKIGLDGRVVLPLIMGFGCNLPSLAAARALPSAKQRLVTAIITPYTSCAARLTVYLMVAKIFFPDNAGTVVFAMYTVSVVLVVLAAWVLKFFITKESTKSPLILLLPAYQVPRLLVLFKTTLRRSLSFVTGAGKIIVAMTVVVWLLGAIPMGAGGSGKSFADAELAMEDSAYGQVAKVLEPVFAPAGFADWHLTGSLMTGFVAKETMVSSIVVSYKLDASAAGDAEENGDDLGQLPELMTDTFTKTAGAEYAGLAAIAFLVFVLSYTPCLATVGEQVRLIGG